MDSVNIYEVTADFYYTDIEKMNAYFYSKIFKGDTSGYNFLLFNQDIKNPDNLASLTQDQTLIRLFESVEEKEMRDFLYAPIAWKDYSSQTFRFTPAKGIWTLSIKNLDEYHSYRITEATVNFAVAKNYTCHEGCEFCYDSNGCAGDCLYGYGLFSTDYCHKKIEYCVEQEGDVCLECNSGYKHGWNWEYCT